MGRPERMVWVVRTILVVGVTLLMGPPLQAQTGLFGPTPYTCTAGPPNQVTDSSLRAAIPL